MSSSYLIPIVVWLPKGYDCTVVMPLEAIGRLLTGGAGRIVRAWTAYCGGEEVAAEEETIVFEGGKPVGTPASEVVWRGADREDWPEGGGYLEFAIRTPDGTPLFTTNAPPGFYNIFTAPGRKSCFACHTWKFGSPQVIGQIAEFGRYIDAYPVINIDRARDFGNSLVLINPYKKAILAQVLTHDGRRPKRQRVEPMSARLIDLAALIAPDEECWRGQIQLTANNRVITQILKHSLADPTRISMIEHLDPFRADPTHVPFFQWLRLSYGEMMRGRESRHARR
jgi:hypothetical protein